MQYKKTNDNDIELSELIKEVKASKKVHENTGTLMYQYNEFVINMIEQSGISATVYGISDAFNEKDFPCFKDITICIKKNEAKAQ